MSGIKGQSSYGFLSLPHTHTQANHQRSTYIHLLNSDSASLTETNSERGSNSAAAKTTLLTSSCQERDQTDSGTTTDIESTNTLGAVNLVPTDTEQVNVHLGDIDGDLADSLGSVGMEKDLLGAAELANLLQGLDHTDLVVDSHDGDQGGVGADSSLEVIHGDQSVLSHGQVGDLETFIGQNTARIQNALVLLDEDHL